MRKRERERIIFYIFILSLCVFVIIAIFKYKNNKRMNESLFLFQIFFSLLFYKKTLEETNAFEIETSDGKSVLVKLKQPIRDMLSSIVEVYGTVDDKCNIACLNYATFDQEAIENFDMNLYNETVQMTHQLPSHYIQV